MPDCDREARILELRRLVQSGGYQIDPQQVAAAIVRESEQGRIARCAAEDATPQRTES